jgi:hypothetical protein
MPGRAGDGDVPLPIGPQRRHPEPREFGEQDRRRMAVVVVRADADHRHRRVDRSQKRRLRIGGPVVRHFEDVRAQVRAGGDQRPLRLDLGVARQEDPHAADLGAQHQGGVVRIGPGAVERPGRPEDVEVDVADVEGRPFRRRQHRPPHRGRDAMHDD